MPDPVPVHPGEGREDILHFRERNGVPHLSAAAEQSDAVTRVLGEHRQTRGPRIDSREPEVEVVHDDIFDPRSGEDRGDGRLPHPLGEPEPAGPGAREGFEPVVHRDDLGLDVGPAEDGYDGLVVPAREEFQPSLGAEGRHAPQVVGAAGLDPVEETAGMMHRQAYSGMPLDAFENGLVAVGVGLLDDFVEVAHRLMVVEAQGQLQGEPPATVGGNRRNPPG